MADHILKTTEVIALTGLSESTLRRAIKSGTFPKPRRLSERSVGFLASEIEAWLEQLKEAA